MSRCVVFIVFGLITALIACSQQPGGAAYIEIRSLANSADQEKRFSQYSVEEQIDIYLYSQLYAQDTVGILYMIAEDGDRKVPALLRRMDSFSSADPWPRVALIQVLGLIELRCECLHKTEGVYETLARNEIGIEESDSEGIKEYKRLYKTIRANIESKRQRN